MVVLNADEMAGFLEAVPSLKTRAALTMAYSARFRAAEAIELKVTDIASGQMANAVGDDPTLMWVMSCSSSTKH